MSRWDIFRWRTLAGGPPCRQGRQRFSHQAFLSNRPKRVPPYWYKRRRGDTELCGTLASCPLSRLAATAPPKGEPSLASPFGGGGLALARTERARCQRLPRMGCVEALAGCPLSRLTATAPPKGEPSLASPFGGGGLALARTERARCQRPPRMGCVEALAGGPLSHGWRRASVSAAASVGRWATSHRDVAAPEGGAE